MNSANRATEAPPIDKEMWIAIRDACLARLALAELEIKCADLDLYDESMTESERERVLIEARAIKLALKEIPILERAIPLIDKQIAQCERIARPRIIEARDVTILIKTELRQHWPDVRFSVRQTLHGGTVVSWFRGPDQKEVAEKLKIFWGAEFDEVSDSWRRAPKVWRGELVQFGINSVMTDRIEDLGRRRKSNL